MSNKRIITDAYRWFYNRYVKGDPNLVDFAQEIRAKGLLAQQIYDIRNRLHMTREDLAEFSGLTPEAIEDLEETDYDGDWNEAIEKVNSGFHNWFTDVILPAARMKPEDYSVGVVSWSSGLKRP